MIANKQIKKKCPIPIVHSRIKDVYELWHKAASKYQFPRAFRINLNSIIQEMRNVTFLLQSEKKSIPKFKEWYQQWQEAMRKDEILVWVKKARNRVVKQGDLEINSIARVKILTWDDTPILELEVPPLIPTESIAVYLATKDLKIPNYIRKVGVLDIERRWSVVDFPNKELLRLLAHSIEFLTKLIKDAHKQCGIKISDCQNYRYFPRLNKKSIVKNVRLSLADKKILTPHTVPLKLTEEMSKKVEKRYKFKTIKKIKELHKDETPNPFNEIEFFLERSKRMLLKDKCHIHFLLLYFPDERDNKMLELILRDQAEKFLAMREIADEVARSGATGFLYIGEIWMAPEEKCKERKIMPSESPHRREALSLTAATSDGQIRTYITEFNRGLFGRIKLNPTETIDHQDNYIDRFFEPIMKVWRERRKTSKSRKNYQLNNSR